MKIYFLNIILILISFRGLKAQTWEQMEEEYYIYYDSKDYHLALKKSKEMLLKSTAEEGKQSRKTAFSYGYIASVYEELLNDSCLLYYKKGYEIMWQNKEHSDLETANGLTMFASKGSKEDYEKSIKMFQRSIEIYRSSQHTSMLNQPLQGLVDLYFSNGDYLKAQYYSFELCDIYSEMSPFNDTLMVDAVAQLGLINMRLGDYNFSEKCFKIAIEGSEKVRGYNNIANAFYLNNLANLYILMDKYFEAEKLYIEVLDIKGKLMSIYDESYYFTLSDQAVLFEKLGKFKKAEENYLKVIDYSIKSLGLINLDRAMASTNLSTLKKELNKYDEAEKYAYDAVDIYRKKSGIQHPYYASALSNLADIYRAKRNYSKALPLYLETLEVRKKILGEQNPEYANSLSSLSHLYFELGRYKEAEKTINKAFVIYNHFSRNGGNRYDDCLLSLANINLKLGNYKKANLFIDSLYQNRVKFISSMFAFLSENERENFWSYEAPLFQKMISISIEANKENPEVSQLVYNSCLMTKSLLMQSNNEWNKIIDGSLDSNIIEVNNLLKVKKSIYSKAYSEGSQNHETLIGLEASIDSLDQLLSRKVSAYAENKKNFSLTWKDVQKKLDNGEASIEFAKYYVAKDSSYYYSALIVKHSDNYPILIKLCRENELEKLSPEKELNELYDLIWKPLISQLSGVKTIYYSPVGLLNNIPFHALFEYKKEQRNYVIDNFTLHQLTSTRYLALGLKLKDNNIIENTIALFGGINYDEFPSSLSNNTNDLAIESAFLYKNLVAQRNLQDTTRTGLLYLAGTKQEVENIAKGLKNNNWNVDVIEGKDASELKVKSFSGSNSKSILHIATHGFAFPDREESEEQKYDYRQSGQEFKKYKVSNNPMIRCGLLFSGANMTWIGKGDSLLETTKEDGVLTAYELSNLALNKTKLVVLSACETGKGEIQGSEGTFGLKRALKLAGVDNMIVSLWEVPDEPTMEMMTLFYEELVKSKNPVTSFELAQKIMRNKYPENPENWAGFVFVR